VPQWGTRKKRAGGRPQDRIRRGGGGSQKIKDVKVEKKHRSAVKAKKWEPYELKARKISHK